MALMMFSVKNGTQHSRNTPVNEYTVTWFITTARGSIGEQMHDHVVYLFDVYRRHWMLHLITLEPNNKTWALTHKAGESGRNYEIEIPNIRKYHGKTFVSRQQTEKSGRNGLPDVLVWGKVTQGNWLKIVTPQTHRDINVFMRKQPAKELRQKVSHIDYSARKSSDEQLCWLISPYT